jgi:hypothetical protein
VDWKLTAVRRPPHAAEGAYACAILLQNSFAAALDETLWRAALTAITRHHGAFTADLTEFHLIPKAIDFVRQTLGNFIPVDGLIDRPTSGDCRRFHESLVESMTPEQLSALLLYFYLVRRLRLADQNSFKEK